MKRMVGTVAALLVVGAVLINDVTLPPEAPGDDAPAGTETSTRSAPLSAAPRTLAPRVPQDVDPAVVTSITDGDTLRVDVDGRNEPVRLLAIDTPEVSGDCGAVEATEALEALLPAGSAVWLETDVEGRDRYGRLLRYIWRRNGLLVNRALVRHGWARAQLYPPNDRRWTTIRQAQEQAQAEHAGLWTLCGWTEHQDAPPPPPAPTDAAACDPNYSGCVPPYPPDVDCGRVKGPVTVVGTDLHNLDGDGDQVACEPPPG